MESQLRRRAGMPKKNTIARAVPPADGQNSFIGLFCAVVGAVVDIVKVDVGAVVPLIVTEAGLRAQVAGSVAPLGPATVQVRAIAPVNPPDGVTVIVDVFPLIAPGLTLMLPLFVSAKLGAILVPLSVTV